MIDGGMSDWVNVTLGVPQGSVFRSLLFLLFINDLPGVLKCKSKFFPDDGDLYAQVTDSKLSHTG